MEPIAYLTVEVKHRDLDSRLLVASHLVEAGISVVVGQQWALFANADALPPGIVLFKTVNEIQANNMANFRRAGHLVAATDEEVLQCIDDRCFMLAFSPTAVANCDVFLAQSAAHQGAIERMFSTMKGRVEVAGNSRIDLMSPHGRRSFAGEAENLKRKFGPYVLFNTNFGSINSIWNDVNRVIDIGARAGAFNPKDPKSVEEFMALIEWERKNHAELLPLMHWAVNTLSGHRIVIRPHPGERPEFWEEQFGKNPRVTIVPRSNPHPWILGSELVIHTGCTTGLEAALMDKPTINLMPSVHPSFDRIVNWVNPTFTAWKDAAEATQLFLDKGKGPVTANAETYKAVLAQYLPGYQSGDAARSIAASLLDRLIAVGGAPRKGYRLRYRAPGLRMMDRPAVLRDKFSIGRAEFTGSVRLARHLTGHASMPTIETLDDSLFMISTA